jgi:PiT family inorganic phosphate transporter
VTAAAWAGLTALIVLFGAVAAANDGGNLAATLVASGTLTELGSSLLVLAAVSAGPWLVGTAVARTVALQIVDLVHLGPPVLVAGILGAVASVGVSYARRLPTSTSMALVGGLVGAGWVAGGGRAVHWAGVARVLGGMLLAVVMGFVLGWLCRKLADRALRPRQIRRGGWLRALQAGASALQGIGYGGNDAEKVTGLLALLGVWSRSPGQPFVVPAWAVVGSTLVFGVGMLAGGRRIMKTVAFRIFRVRVPDALAAQTGSAVAVIGAALGGYPVSTTSSATTALLGVGAAHRLSLPRWQVVREIALAWAVTLPLAAALAAVLMLAVRG